MGRLVESDLEPGSFDVFNDAGKHLGVVERYIGTILFGFFPVSHGLPRFLGQDTTEIRLKLAVRYSEAFTIGRNR